MVSIGEDMELARLESRFRTLRERRIGWVDVPLESKDLLPHPDAAIRGIRARKHVLVVLRFQIHMGQWMVAKESMAWGDPGAREPFDEYEVEAYVPVADPIRYLRNFMRVQRYRLAHAQYDAGARHWRNVVRRRRQRLAGLAALDRKGMPPDMMRKIMGLSG